MLRTTPDRRLNRAGALRRGGGSAALGAFVDPGTAEKTLALAAVGRI